MSINSPVIVKVVAEVTVYVLEPTVKVVGVGQIVTKVETVAVVKTGEGVE